MSFSEDHGLTTAGKEFVLGYMAQSDPGLAAKAVETLKDLAADGIPPGPEYWFKVPI
jgi:hypothetical protein